ncbi:MAG: bile acid:sodium symporter [Deltaproteobacteria bacterium]|nr:MAG: bile acid:sodium symporter [Deltaproteobacteria bacterium]
MGEQLHGWIKKYWFMIGLIAVFAATLADTTETVSAMGQWFKMHYGPDVAVIMIFFFSGLLLEADQISSGLKDFTGTLIALSVIFLVSPLTAILFHLIPLDTGLKIGIFLVAVMPSTLSSGVVMTGAAGGNMAHALVITILSNGLAVFSIPIALSILLNPFGGATDVIINKAAIMLKIAGIVILPLCVGLATKYYAKTFTNRFESKLQLLNQYLIFGIVWMALSSVRSTILSSGQVIGIIFGLAFVFHGLLLATAGILSWGFQLGPGRREGVIFMGGQKTLPLSVILQVSLFPQYGLALVFCVVHHVVHLLMDGYLVGRFRSYGRGR